ncbi:DUF397 domain-containing protein [Actinomadura physcomitrii]|nr:DUF397 domain-containing protein [Actinomadura physcomitrii]
MTRRPRDLGVPKNPVEYFAAELRACRERAELGRPLLAARLGYTPQWIGRLENATHAPSEDFAKDCDTLFETKGLKGSYPGVLGAFTILGLDDESDAAYVDTSMVQWRKSSRSTDTGGQCVEVASLAPDVGVRDSKDTDGPALVFSVGEWRAFARRVKSGGHDIG